MAIVNIEPFQNFRRNSVPFIFLQPLQEHEQDIYEIHGPEDQKPSQGQTTAVQPNHMRSKKEVMAETE